MASIKTKKKYRVITAMNPKTQEKTLLRPIIDERETYYSDHVVEYALKNGYVRGQFHDMLGALNGFVQAIQELGKEGKDVNLSNWLRVHGELTGTVEAKNPVLTSKNEYKVCITALKELKLKADAFAWTRTDGPEPIEANPKIVSIMSGRTGVEGQVKGMDDTITITGSDVDFTGARGRYVMVRRDGREDITTSFDDSRDTYEYISPTVMTMKLIGNYSSEPDDNWSSNYLSDEKYLEVRLADGKILRYPMTFING